MRYRHSLLLLGILLIACQATAPGPEPTSPPAGLTPSPTPVTATATITVSKPAVDDHLQQLAAEFRVIREIPGRFGGGEPNPEVDQWQGRKHQIMLELGSALGAGDLSQAQLVELLGPADHVVTAGDPLMPYIASLPNYNQYAAGDTFLVYEWRGTHDFLFFALQDDRVITADWWYAFE